MNLKEHFEANMLDGDDIEHCGGAMISGLDEEEYGEIQERYSTLEEAEAGHKKMVEKYLVEKKGEPFPCGCAMTVPHSHLVYNHECPCEKGRPSKSLT